MHLDVFYFTSSYPVERQGGHPVPVALEVDVSCLLVDAHGKVSVIHPQGCLHCCLWVITNGQSILKTYLTGYWNAGSPVRTWSLLIRNKGWSRTINASFEEEQREEQWQQRDFNHCRPHLQVHVSQLVLLDQVIDASHLQPGLRLLLPLAQIDRNPQALLRIVQRFTRRSATRNP